jgi:hypothetical protein
MSEAVRDGVFEAPTGYPVAWSDADVSRLEAALAKMVKP